MGNRSDDSQVYVTVEQFRKIIMILFAYLVVVTLLLAYSVYKVSVTSNENRAQAKQLAQSLQFQHDQVIRNAVIQCRTSNDARKSLIDLLKFIQHRVATMPVNPTFTQKEKDEALHTYDQLIGRVHIITCPKSPTDKNTP